MPGARQPQSLIRGPGDHSACERLQRQRRQINLSPQLRICRQDHLKSAVETKTVDHVSADAAAHIIGGLADYDLQPATLQMTGGG